MMFDDDNNDDDDTNGITCSALSYSFSIDTLAISDRVLCLWYAKKQVF